MRYFGGLGNIGNMNIPSLICLIFLKISQANNILLSRQIADESCCTVSSYVYAKSQGGLGGGGVRGVGLIRKKLWIIGIYD